MIPMVLLVGFLGAGKTRFLTQVIPAMHARGLRPRVILNDFENATIDAARLAELDALVTPLDGECVCCGSLTELMDALYAVRGEPGDVMLIEANGATVADELLGYLTMDRQLAHFTLPMQVTVIDAARWQKRWWHNTLEADQARTATHLLLNWTHRLDSAHLQRVEASVRAVNAHAVVTTTDAFADTLASLAAASRDTPLRRMGLPLAAAASSHADHAAPVPHGHAHPFASATLPLPALVERAAFLAFVRAMPPRVVRAKGFVRFTDTPTTMFVWNRVGGRKSVMLDESSPHATAQPTALFIGVDLPLAQLAAAIGALQ